MTKRSGFPLKLQAFHGIARFCALACVAGLAAGCSGGHGPTLPAGLPATTSPSGASSAEMNGLYPQSQSPASLDPGPMPQTQLQPASAMAAVPQSAVPASIGALKWTQVSGAATSVAVAPPDGSLWALSTTPAGVNKSIWHYASGTWTNIPGSAANIAVAPNGTLYAVNGTTGGVYAYNGTSWSSLGGGARWVTTGADNAVYVLSNAHVVSGNSAIWKYAGGTWTQQPGSASQLAGSFDSNNYSVSGVGAVAPNGYFAVNSSGGTYYYSPGTGYVHFPGSASGVAPITGGVFRLNYPAAPGGAGLSYFDYGSTAWAAEPGTGVSAAAGPGSGGTGNQLYIVNAAHAIWTTPITPGAAPANVAYLTPAGAGFTGSIPATADWGIVAALSQSYVSNAQPPADTIDLKLGASATTYSLPNSSRTTSLASILQRPAAQDTVLAPKRPPEAFIDDGAILQRATRYRAQHAAGLTSASAKIVQPQSLPTSPGVTAPIWLMVFPIGSSSVTWIQEPFTLKLSTAHGYIWIDSSLTLAQTSIDAIGADFENAYASDTQHFGTPEYPATGQAAVPVGACDTNGNPITGQITTQYIAPPNGHHHVVVIDPSHLGAGVGGYFTSLNFYPQAYLNCWFPGSHSNEASMIIMEYYAPNGDAYETQEDLVRGTSHEFQHLINFVDHAVLSNNPTGESSWLNEGMSMLAQDFAVNRMFPSLPLDVDDALWRANTYLANPATHSLTAFAGNDSGGSTFSYNCSGCYGLSYLFMRYNYDRFGGDAFLAKMENQNGLAGLPELQAATGILPAANISDFGMALVATGLVTVSDPRFKFTNLNPLGTYTDQFGNKLTLNGVSVTQQSANTDVSRSLYNGTFNYFQVPNAAHTGAGVTITDVGGIFNLNPGLVRP